jgi:hypothetical protein
MAPRPNKSLRCWLPKPWTETCVCGVSRRLHTLAMPLASSVCLTNQTRENSDLVGSLGRRMVASFNTVKGTWFNLLCTATRRPLYADPRSIDKPAHGMCVQKESLMRLFLPSRMLSPSAATGPLLHCSPCLATSAFNNTISTLAASPQWLLTYNMRLPTPLHLLLVLWMSRSRSKLRRNLLRRTRSRRHHSFSWFRKAVKMRVLPCPHYRRLHKRWINWRKSAGTVSGLSAPCQVEAR